MESDWRATGGNVCDGGYLCGHGAWRLASETELLRAICVARSVEFRLRFAFLGIPPMFLQRVKKSFGMIAVQDWEKTRVWKVMILMGLRRGLLTSCGGT